MTLYPRSFRTAAATELSTPPDIATRTVDLVRASCASLHQRRVRLVLQSVCQHAGGHALRAVSVHHQEDGRRGHDLELVRHVQVFGGALESGVVLVLQPLLDLIYVHTDSFGDV